MVKQPDIIGIFVVEAVKEFEIVKEAILSLSKH